MIPKKIHYCWFGGNEMSPLHKACMSTWKKYLPDYEIICWDEKNSPMDTPFIKYHYNKKNWAFVSDYVRLYAIYNYGGIYLDTDFEVLKNLDDLRNNNCFLGEEKKDRITNGICGGIKKHLFYQEAMLFMENRHKNKKVLLISPEVCTRVYNDLEAKKLVGNIKVYTPDFFYPYNPFDNNPKKHFLLADYITDNTYAIHHWGHSWKEAFLSKIINKIKYFVQG